MRNYLLQEEVAQRWALEETRLLNILDHNTIPLSEIMRQMGKVNGEDTWRAVERLTMAGLVKPLGSNPRSNSCLYIRTFPTQVGDSIVVEVDG